MPLESTTKDTKENKMEVDTIAPPAAIKNILIGEIG